MFQQVERQKDRKTKDTLCWHCAKCTGHCCWSSHFQPVKGWDAIPTKIRTRDFLGNLNVIESFKVIKCPEFENDADILSVKDNSKSKLNTRQNKIYEKLKKQKENEKWLSYMKT